MPNKTWKDGKWPEGYVEGRRLPLPSGEIDLAKGAECWSANGLSSRLAMATDGSTGTSQRGPFVLSFPQPVVVTGFRWTLPPTVADIWADTTGDGKVDTLLYRNWNGYSFSTWKNLQEYVWLTGRFAKPTKVHRILCTAGAHEFELLGPASETARLESAPWEGGRLKNPLVYDDYPSTAFKAGPLVTYFNKGTYANFWRYNFIFEKGGPRCREATAVAGRLTKILSAWGGKRASVPKDVLVLRSRTSEDWWALKERAKADKTPSPAAKRAIELGFTQFFWTAARLCEKAVPFEIYPLHRVETWKDIARDYKVIVLPFAYALSGEEIAALKAAAQAGVKILAPGGYPLGAVDETGSARPAGAVAGLNVERLAFDPLKDKATRRLAEAFDAQLAAALKARGGVSLSLAAAPDHDVQAYRLDAADGAALVLVVNWSERATEADVRVRLPFDRGALEVVTEDGVYDASFSADVRLSLPKESVRMLRYSRER